MLARGSERGAPCGIADQHFHHPGKRHRVSRRDEQPGHPLLDQLWNPRHVGCDAGEPLALRLNQNVGKTVAVAVLCHL